MKLIFHGPINATQHAKLWWTLFCEAQQKMTDYATELSDTIYTEETHPCGSFLADIPKRIDRKNELSALIQRCQRESDYYHAKTEALFPDTNLLACWETGQEPAFIITLEGGAG